MYPTFLTIHSLLRWLVVVTAVFAAARAIRGVSAHRAWTPADDRAGLWLVITLDVQFLIGAILYVALTPFTIAAFSNLAGVMRDPALRFFVVEHVVGMIIAIALVHIGRVRIRKTIDMTRRHKLAAIFFGIALAVILLSIPWPSMPGHRPLFRGF